MSNNATYGSGLYAHHKIANVEYIAPGYIKAYIVPISKVTTFTYPTQGGTPALGELHKTASAHTMSTGAIEVYVHRDSLESSGAAAGDTQAKVIVYKPKIFILGDGPKIQEIVYNLKNDALALFLKLECEGEGTYEQYGNDKDPMYLTDINFNSGTYQGGKKGWELTGETRTKEFHTATLDTSLS